MVASGRRLALRQWGSVIGLVLLVALGLSACAGGASGGGGGAAELSARPFADDLPVDFDDLPDASPASGPSTTAAGAPGTTVTTQPLPGLAVGASGPEVLALEQKLESLKYYVGTVDSNYDADTRNGVMAFQKVTGMERTGRATDDVIAAVKEAKDSPKPLVPAGGFKRVEVDLDRQVLFFYEQNNLDVILAVSTGNNQRFCSEGWCRRAVTPTGSFTVYEKRTGWERGPLGRLYNSQYFNGGIAIHGSTSIPAHPASHGCVRISMNAAEWFPAKLSIGTPVYVVSADDPAPTPVGFNAAPVSTPTTIVPDVPTSVATPTPTTTSNLLNQLLSPPTSATAAPRP